MMKQIWQHKLAAILAVGLAAGAASAAGANGRRDIPDPQQQSGSSAGTGGAFPPAPSPAGAAADNGGPNNAAPNNSGPNGQPAAPNANNDGGAALWPSVAAQQQAAPAAGAPAPAAGAAAPANAAPAAAPGNAAAAEQQLRDLQNQVQALQQKLNSLENGGPAAANPAPAANAGQTPAPAIAPATAAAVSAAAAKAPPPAQAEETPTYQVPANISADDLYQQGRDFMAGDNYVNGAVAWQAFIDRFPQDPRAADAAFLVGECYYARGLYGKAAEAYLKGRTNYKDAAIAPQNLLKLALSMENLGDKDTACATIGALQRDYRNAPPAVLQRADNSARNMQCP